MNSIKGPILILAAAVVWSGTASFYMARPGDRFFEYSGNAGYTVAIMLLLWGIIETVRRSQA